MMRNLLNIIKNNLSNINASSHILSLQTAPDKLYEIYVLLCVVRALRRINAFLQVRDEYDRQTTNLFFRLGPGLIYSPYSRTGFIYVNYNGKEYEIQNSLRVFGNSRVLHELDVCVIKRNHALRCRNDQTNPNASNIVFLAECKFYGTTLPLHLGREYLGLCKEFSMRVKTIVSNSYSDDIHNLITNHGGTENFSVSPYQNDDMFVQWLANEFRQIL